jgi:hypothetical protein
MAREDQQNLMIPEKEALVRWVTQSTMTEYAPQHHLLRAMAYLEEIIFPRKRLQLIQPTH